MPTAHKSQLAYADRQAICVKLIANDGMSFHPKGAFRGHLGLRSPAPLCVRSRHPRYLPERSLGKETTSCENVVDGSCWIVRKQNDREAFSHALRTVARLSRPAWRP